MIRDNHYHLFLRQDKRIENTHLADFLNGHCIRFQDFAFSYLKADKSRHVPMCLECCQYPDSVQHKVFECSLFDTEDRVYLRETIGHLEHNFHIGIIFAKADHDRKDILAAFCRQAEIICEQSAFKDELLTQSQQRRTQNN